MQHADLAGSESDVHSEEQAAGSDFDVVSDDFVDSDDDELSDDELVSDEDGSDSGGGARRHSERQRQRRLRQREVVAAAAAPGVRTRRSGRLVAAETDSGHAGEHAAGEPAAEETGLEGGGNERAGGRRRQAGSSRPDACYSWLAEAFQSPGVYVPQLGDAVVYLWQGHKQYLDAIGDAVTIRPWEMLQQLGELVTAGQQGPPEEARKSLFKQQLVFDKQFNPAAGYGSAGSLESVDGPPAGAPAAGACFQVLLPHPSTGAQPFVVLQQHFEAALQRRWQSGDRVQGFVGDDSHPEGGVWVAGTVAASKRASDGDATPASVDPYACLELWQQYQVVWDSANDGAALEGHVTGGPPASAGGGDAAAFANSNPWALADRAVDQALAGSQAGMAEARSFPAGAEASDAGAAVVSSAATWMSAWQLYPVGRTVEEVLDEDHPALLPTEQVAVLLQLLEQLRRKPMFRLFVLAPAASAVFDTAQGEQAYNRMVPLPLGLDNLQERVEGGYYRSMQALLHDAALIASNAALFNGWDSPLAAKAAELAKQVMAEFAADLAGSDHNMAPGQVMGRQWGSSPSSSSDQGSGKRWLVEH
eukprot:gene10776-10932_t